MIYYICILNEVEVLILRKEFTLLKSTPFSISLGKMALSESPSVFCNIDLPILKLLLLKDNIK